MSKPRRILFLIAESLSDARREEVRQLAAGAKNAAAEIMVLTEANSREALEKLFAADTVTVWSE